MQGSRLAAVAAARQGDLRGSATSASAGDVTSQEPETGAQRHAAAAVAVLPPDNLSGNPAPLEEIRRAIYDALSRCGAEVLDERVLERFMAMHRVRYTGGVSKELARQFADEGPAGTILVTTLDQYEEPDPPRLALTLRLVSAAEAASILWIDSIDLAGNESPGLLGLGAVTDPRVLRDRAVGRLVDSLAAFLSRASVQPGFSGTSGRPGAAAAGSAPSTAERGRRFRPKRFFRSQASGTGTAQGRPLRVAVLPFSNESGRGDAGDLMMLHFVRQLVRLPAVEVVEPGVVREALLQSRLIMEGGPSMPQSDLLRTLLDVDLALTGHVSDYQDYGGPWGHPVVVFSARGIDTRTRQVVWASFSDNRGDDGVVFFDWRRVRTVHALAAAMAHQAVEKFMGEHGS